jgi:hypothetical protein
MDMETYVAYALYTNKIKLYIPLSLTMEMYVLKFTHYKYNFIIFHLWNMLAKRSNLSLQKQTLRTRNYVTQTRA